MEGGGPGVGVSENFPRTPLPRRKNPSREPFRDDAGLRRSGPHDLVAVVLDAGDRAGGCRLGDFSDRVPLSPRPDPDALEHLWPGRWLRSQVLGALPDARHDDRDASPVCAPAGPFAPELRGRLVPLDVSVPD